MKHPYNKKFLLDLISEYSKKYDLVVNPSSVINSVQKEKLDMIKNIFKGSISQYRVTIDALIASYYYLLKYFDDLKPIEEYFEPEEITIFKRPPIARPDIDLKKISSNKMEWKEAFINDTQFDNSDITKDNLHRLLVTGIVRDYEKNFDKDITEFKREEFLELLSSGTRVSFDTIKSQIKVYLEWCREKGFIPQDAEDKLGGIKWEDVDSSEFYRRKFFKDFKQITSLFDFMRDDHSYKKNRKVVDFLTEIRGVVIPALCLLWIGFTKDETLSIRRNDVDLRNNTISFKGKTIQIPDEMILYIVTAHNISQGAEYFVWDDSKLFSEKIDYGELFIKISAFSKYLENNDLHKISYLSVYKSGIFNRMQLWENAAGKNIIFINRSEMSNIVLDDISPAKCNQLIDDYEKWKDSFGLRK